MRLVASAVLVLTFVAPALEAGDGLNCRDGKDAPPRLQLVQNLWGLAGYPSTKDEWPLERKLAEIKAAGFDAFDVWLGGAAGGGPRPLGGGGEGERPRGGRRVRGGSARGRRRRDRGREAPRLRVPRRPRRELLHPGGGGGGAAPRPRRALPRGRDATRHPDPSRAGHAGPAAHGGLRAADTRLALRRRLLPLHRGGRDGRRVLEGGGGGALRPRRPGDHARRPRLERGAGPGGHREPGVRPTRGAHGRDVEARDGPVAEVRRARRRLPLPGRARPARLRDPRRRTAARSRTAGSSRRR